MFCSNISYFTVIYRNNRIESVLLFSENFIYPLLFIISLLYLFILYLVSFLLLIDFLLHLLTCCVYTVLQYFFECFSTISHFSLTIFLFHFVSIIILILLSFYLLLSPAITFHLSISFSFSRCFPLLFVSNNSMSSSLFQGNFYFPIFSYFCTLSSCTFFISAFLSSIPFLWNYIFIQKCFTKHSVLANFQRSMSPLRCFRTRLMWLLLGTFHLPLSEATWLHTPFFGPVYRQLFTKSHLINRPIAKTIPIHFAPQNNGKTNFRASKSICSTSLQFH